MRELNQAALEKAVLAGRAAYQYAPRFDTTVAAKTIRAYLDATAPSRAPTCEITMQDVRLIAGEGKLNASDVLAAVNAHLRTNAPSRAPDGVVTREEIARLIADELGFPYDGQHFGKAEWVQTRGEKGGRSHDINEPYQSDFDAAADAVIARLAANHAGNRERHGMEDMPTDRRVLVDFMGQGWLVAYAEPGEPEMLRRCIGFGKSERYATVAKDYATGWMELPPSHGLAPAAGQDDAGEKHS